MAKKLSITEIVYGYKTKHAQGFTHAEMEDLLATQFPKVGKEKFYEALGINTVMVIDGETVTYHTDVQQALYAVVENKRPHPLAWD